MDKKILIEQCGAGIRDLESGFQDRRPNQAYLYNLTLYDPFSRFQNPCGSFPRVSNATCQPTFLKDESFVCKCPPGFEGHSCQTGNVNFQFNLFIVLLLKKCLF